MVIPSMLMYGQSYKHMVSHKRMQAASGANLPKNLTSEREPSASLKLCLQHNLPSYCTCVQPYLNGEFLQPPSEPLTLTVCLSGLRICGSVSPTLLVASCGPFPYPLPPYPSALALLPASGSHSDNRVTVSALFGLFQVDPDP